MSTPVISSIFFVCCRLSVIYMNVEFYYITRIPTFSYETSILLILAGYAWWWLKLSQSNRSIHSLQKKGYDYIWDMTWDFQQCGMCDQQSSDQPAHMRSLIRAFASCLNILWILSNWGNIIWSFLALLVAAQARLSLFMSKCHIYENHMSLLI